MFTKVYKEEDERLRGCSYNVASIYFHLKNKRDYFKSEECYDFIKCISDYTGMSKSTIIRAISTLRKLGLLQTTIKGKVNHYSFPIADAIANGAEIPVFQKPQKKNHVKSQKEQINNSNNPKPEEDMGNPTNIIVSNGKAVIVNEPAVEYRGYSKEYIEEIKRKLIEKNTPNLVNAVIPTNDAPVVSNIPSFQDFITKTAFTINDIIQDYNDGSGIRKMQGDERLRELLNTKYGIFYKEELTEYINNHVNIQYKADLSHSNIEDDNLYHQEDKSAKNDPKTDFISDEQKYGSDVVDLIEDNPEIITALKSVVEYHSGDIDKEYQASMANTKIDQIVRSRNNDSDFVRRVEKFCADFITEYKESIFNKNNNEE